MDNTNRFLHDELLVKLRDELKQENELMKKGIHVDAKSNKQYFTGYSYNTLYDWDMYFESIVQIYMGWPGEYIKNGIIIFLENQQASGLIPRSVPCHKLWANEHCKPFLAQAVLLVENGFGETDWLSEKNYQRLKKYIEYWLKDMDSVGDGLSEYMSAPHSGMDNHHERAGHWNERISKGVDLNCYLYREMLAFARIAEQFDKNNDAKEYRQKAEALKTQINKRMWNDKAGFYFDINIKTGEQIPLVAISGLTPLWANIAPKERAERMVNDYISNPEQFWTKYPLPAVAKNQAAYSSKPFDTDVLGKETCNWRACTWMPTNYMVYRGLKNYGYNQIASLIAKKTLEMLKKNGNCEWYDAQSGEGKGLNPFWGWSLLGYFFDFEEQSPCDSAHPYLFKLT